MSAHRDRVRGRGRARSRGRDESGNILVLFAILLPLFMFVGMVVIDVGYWWANGRKAQIAADACALAAARELPQNWTPALSECEFDGRDYVLTNLPDQSGGASTEPFHVSTAVLSPFEGNPTQVEATVTMRVRTFFGRFIGLGGIELSRRAVAEQSVGAGEWAIYSHDPVGCVAGNGLEINGAAIEVDGRVHSNSFYHVNSGHAASGDNFWADVGTISASPCNPTLDPSPSGAAYGTGPEPRPHLPSDTNFEPWPTWYTPAQFNWPNCSGANFSARNINIKGDKIELKSPLSGGGDRDISHSGTVPTGTYCATEKLTTSDSVRGRVTLISPQLDISGNTDFDANQHNVLFFSVPNWISGNWGADTLSSNDGVPMGTGFLTCTDPSIEMKLNGGTVDWKGTIFNPCGRVNLNNSPSTNGGNPHLVGSIIAEMVKVNQPGFMLQGQSNFGGTIVLALDQ
jgi:Putative Flp pilus-assembly TadE/G-like